MSDINVKFIHPTDGRELTVTLDNSITGQEAVAELISASFIEPDSQGYSLAIKGGNQISPNATFAESGVKEPDQNMIRVVPATDAGN